MTIWLALALFGAQHTDLIHISDSHVTQLAGVHPDLVKARQSNAESLGKLERFVVAMNALPAATIVHTGDIVDATCFDSAAGGAPVGGQVEAFRQAMRKLKHRAHLALGNHDLECYRRDPAKPGVAVGDQRVAAEARREWGRAFKPLRKRSYYSTRVARGYRLILLDNGESFEMPGGREGFARQMAWLREELRKHPGDKVIVAYHIPLADDERSRMMKAVLAPAGNVVLLLCGHRHTDDLSPAVLAEGRQVPQLRTAALFRGPETWRRIRLKAEAIEISATGEPERVVATIPAR